MVVDRLLASVKPIFLRKLKVYTFGSVANHFHGGDTLRNIEHFANHRDFIAKTGNLAYAWQSGNMYDGIVHSDLNSTGHLLNMHYLAKDISATWSSLAAYLNGGGSKLLSSP